MQIIHFADQPLKTRGINHRQGTFRYVELGEGQPGTPENYNLRWVLSEPDFFSPRHHHNFDQVRIQLRGEFAFDADGLMGPGTVGFFPEGTLYGPQTSTDDTVQLVMQIGAASGNGYLSEAERIAAVDELARRGEFKAGKFYPADGGEPIDGFQAAWEQAMGRKMVYPPQRFSRPLLCYPEAMEWIADPAQPGVASKVMWDFGPRTCGLRLVRQQPGSTATFGGALSVYLLEGQATAAAGESLVKDDVVHLQPGEACTLAARTTTQWAVFMRPVFG